MVMEGESKSGVLLIDILTVFIFLAEDREHVHCIPTMNIDITCI